LEQAVVLADRLAFAFNTRSGVPYNELDFATNSSTQETNGLATTGTLVLEWTRLSDLTGNLTYASLAQKAESYLLRPLPVNIAEPFPGMLGNDINITSGDFTSSAGGWSGGTDSFYEYLLKMWVYSPSRFSTYKDRWIDAVNSTLHYLMQPVSVNPAGSFVMEYNDATSMRQSQGHLTCFIGGNLILGGDVLGRADIKAAGLSLTKGCRDTYASTQSGIGPERWGWDNQSVPTQFTAFYATAGYYPTVMSYDLRPEVVESYYHAFKLTGDERYKDWAWEAFVAIHKACWTKYGYSAIEDVTIANGGGKSDFQESFWFAEVLKYLFLTFQESEVSVKSGRNGWVFNTEAHPLKTMD
jgi:mannosyl-oligosaccharide alpha-1,2-mannosidase